jgi:hypothetical protein
VFLGYISAYQGKFVDAAKYFKRGNEEALAMAMFSDLRMFDQAKVRFVSGTMDLNYAIWRKSKLFGPG